MIIKFNINKMKSIEKFELFTRIFRDKSYIRKKKITKMFNL